MLSSRKNSQVTRESQAETSANWQKEAGMTQENEKLHSVEETGGKLAVSSFTVRRLIKAGEMRAVRVGKRVLIPGSEIERIIAEGCGKHASAR
jgi:excisionase family DNA binding protein